MVTPEITNYIKQQIAVGVSREQISASLKGAGWSDSDVTEAFSAITGTPSIIPQAPMTAQMHTIHKLRNTIIAIVVLVLAGGTLWWFLQNKPTPTTQNEISINNEVKTPAIEDFNALKMSYVAVPAEENSASIFNAIPKNAIAQVDKDFFIKYIKDGFTINLIPLAESRKILAKYKNLLSTFEAGVNKKYYQCSLTMGENCSVGTLRDISNIATLNSIILLKDGKAPEAQNYAQKIINLGQMITASTDDVLDLLIGWIAQKAGYYMLTQIKPDVVLLNDDKNTLINNLREEHRRFLKLIYTHKIEVVDYITDASKKPPIFIDKDLEDSATLYRAETNSFSWKPDEVKKWFYDSFKIELSNVDQPCDSEFKDSYLDLNFDPDDTTQIESVENYVGKIFYTTTHGSLSATSRKRCEVEKLINAL